MARILAYHRYFERCPPVHLLVQGIAGYKAPSSAKNPLLPPPPMPDVED